MFFTGKIVHVRRHGHIQIPKKLLKNINVNINQDSLEIYRQGELIVMKKYSPVCFVTGRPSEDLVELIDGYYFSEEGMRILLKEISRQSIKKRYIHFTENN